MGSIELDNVEEGESQSWINLDLWLQSQPRSYFTPFNLKDMKKELDLPPGSSLEGVFFLFKQH
jgi:hypothetical protein